MPVSVLKITCLLTFRQSLRFRLEKLVFDASDSLNAVPYDTSSGIYQKSPRQVKKQLIALRQELDLLIEDWDLQ